ncbi:MAG: ATP-binding protein, partial [Gammaproteobacteria bacterium]|nr:ATP-binding protein [Gammaproteobacteria bacterium]
SSHDGFAEYYNQRKIKLNKLIEGYICVKMEHIPTTEGGNLFMQVEDSGKGFDFNNIKKSDNSFSGRGLELVRSLCRTVEHDNNGRSIKVCFQWTFT